ncbi:MULTISPECIES: malonate transporter subunit MadL [Salinicola]|nr:MULTISPECIES: malonate transporter subunit MadL [Salinicola]
MTMVIYGVALLAGCMLVGLIIGDVLGQLLGISANLGGVGIAMLLLIFVTGYLKDRGKLPEATESGINFWNAMYIPIVVAMAASQNVAAAFSGGLVAIVAGVLAVALGLALVPVLTGKKGDDARPLDPPASAAMPPSRATTSDRS